MGKPNITLIMADNLGRGEVGFNGDEVIKTPGLDVFASSGVVSIRMVDSREIFLVYRMNREGTISQEERFDTNTGELYQTMTRSYDCFLKC